MDLQMDLQNVFAMFKNDKTEIHVFLEGTSTVLRGTVVQAETDHIKLHCDPKITNDAALMAERWIPYSAIKYVAIHRAD
jgi:hypothetical protein